MWTLFTQALDTSTTSLHPTVINASANLLVSVRPVIPLLSNPPPLTSIQLFFVVYVVAVNHAERFFHVCPRREYGTLYTLTVPRRPTTTAFWKATLPTPLHAPAHSSIRPRQSLLGSMLFGEELSARWWSGFGLISLGVALVHRGATPSAAGKTA